MADYDPNTAEPLPSPVEVERQLERVKEDVRNILRPYAPSEMPIDDFVGLALWTQDNPNEARRLHQEATEKLARHQEAQGNLLRSYRELYAAYKDEEHLMSPDEKLRHKELLQKAYNRLERK